MQMAHRSAKKETAAARSPKKGRDQPELERAIALVNG